MGPQSWTWLSVHTHILLDQLKMLFKKNHGHRVGAGKGGGKEALGRCQSSALPWPNGAQTHWQLPQQFIKSDVN